MSQGSKAVVQVQTLDQLIQTLTVGGIEFLLFFQEHQAGHVTSIYQCFGGSQNYILIVLYCLD